ncbi:MAG: hypothetical protein F4120_02255 [Rhodothermaceae bacterium]|nr:hypothetical protein [Bacteroidota bacterium]MXW14053.1 hypothetical protein [Rhodothermaceae bacterium]MXW32635.1 hypothetical protein [Rhodothermaceae bacterium]MYC03614.1 hypothetical protein [Rhodothermaceae bacterium]MYE62232.1 hypothetical protein [Rhodothermaceae bacterium]
MTRLTSGSNRILARRSSVSTLRSTGFDRADLVALDRSNLLAMTTNNRSPQTPRWVNVVALAVLLVATLMNWMWIWGILFIYWAVPAFLTSETHLVGPISRDTQPVIFWLVTVLWIVLGVVTILLDLAPGAVETVLGS